MLRHLVHAVRSLRRSPSFVAAAAGTLAGVLGIATAVFAIVDSVIHPSLPFRDVDRLVAVSARGDGANGRVTGFQKIDAIRRADVAIDGLALQAFEFQSVEAGSFVEDAVVYRVTPGFFELLGTSPMLGRFFTPATADDDGDRAVVVSYSFWRRALGSARSLGEMRVTADGHSYEVIGVAPYGLEAVEGGSLWFVAPPSAAVTGTGLANASAVVRLRAGATPTSLHRQLLGTAQQLTAAFGLGHSTFGFTVRPIRPDPLELRESHLALMAGALALVLIACANLANLVLARGLAVQHDVAVRLALGARRRDVMVGFMLECLLLSLAGGASGLLVASWVLDAIQRTLPAYVPYLGTLVARVDWRVGAFAFAASVVAALIIGPYPAWRASGVDLSTPLKERSAGTVSRARLRFSALVMAEVMLALTLVSGAGLLVRASKRLRQEDPGFARDQLLEASVSTRWRDTTQVSAGFYDDLVTRIRALPGITAVAWQTELATTRSRLSATVRGEVTREMYLPVVSVVSPDYLRTMGIPVVQGRDFAAGDAAGSGVAILSESVARELWRGESPINERVSLASLHASVSWLPVIGVSRSTGGRGTSFDYYDRGQPEVFIVRTPARQSRTFVVRTSTDGVSGTERALHRLLRDEVPAGLTRWVRPMRESHDAVVAAHGFLSDVFLTLAAFGVLLAGLGLYSVLAYAVAQRTREFAVRRAIGATALDLAREVARDAAVMVLAGTAAGAFLAMWASTLIDPFLFDLYRIDARTLVVAELVVTVATTAACIAPAWSAIRADTVQILRSA